jgi:hypothetical protein
MVAGINAGLQQNLFTLTPGTGPDRKTIYDFTINNIPAIAAVRDCGWDELTFHVALWPAAKGRRWIKAGNAGFLAGELFAYGWLERRNGAWLQFNGHPMLSCRKHRCAIAAALAVPAEGFADHGKFMM